MTAYLAAQGRSVRSHRSRPGLDGEAALRILTDAAACRHRSRPGDRARRPGRAGRTASGRSPSRPAGEHMTTLAVMAWTDRRRRHRPDSSTADRTARGPIDQPGVAVFSGAADALAAAVTLATTTGRALPPSVSIVGRIDRPPRPGTHALTLPGRLAETGEPGDILATEVVRLLIADTGLRYVGSTSSYRHCRTGELDAGPPTDAGNGQSSRRHITVVVAEDAAIIRAGIVSLLTRRRDDHPRRGGRLSTLCSTQSDRHAHSC